MDNLEARIESVKLAMQITGKPDPAKILKTAGEIFTYLKTKND